MRSFLILTGGLLLTTAISIFASPVGPSQGGPSKKPPRLRSVANAVILAQNFQGPMRGKPIKRAPPPAPPLNTGLVRIEFRGRAPGNEKPAIRKAVENDFKNLIDPHLAKNQAGNKRVYARVEQPGWQRKFGNPQVKEPAHAIVHYYGSPDKHPDNILITKPVFEARPEQRRRETIHSTESTTYTIPSPTPNDSEPAESESESDTPPPPKKKKIDNNWRRATIGEAADTIKNYDIAYNGRPTQKLDLAPSRVIPKTRVT